MPRSRITHDNNAVSTNERRCCVVLLVVATLIALHPISAHDMWWQLSRGRAVVNGTSAPGQILVADTVTAEADWLAGVPLYVIHSTGGAAALMAIKILAAICIAVDLFFQKTSQRNLVNLAIVLLTLLAARQAWAPSSLLYDTLGVSFIWWASHRLRTQISAWRVLLLVVMTIAWANFGPLCLLAIPVAASAMALDSQSLRSGMTPRTKAILLALLIVACCVTPRGPATLWDSVRLLIPVLTVNATALQATPWQPLAFAIHHPETIAFVMISIAVFWTILRDRVTTGTVVLIFAIQILAWSAQSNLAPCAIWMALLLLRLKQQQSSETIIPAPFRSRLVSVCGRQILPAGAVLMVAVAAINPWPGSSSRVGWGIDPSISGTAFEESLQNVKTSSSAHCLGIREAGLLSWFKPDGAKPFDTPQQALLSGRLRENVLLNEELSTGWQSPHRRADDSWGGWWLTLKERRTRLLIASTDDVSFIRALEPTTWKPLSLNGPCLVFGTAGDPACSPEIVGCLRLRQHVDQGDWAHVSAPAAGAGEYLDLVGLLTGISNFTVDIRVAKVFRAMRLNVAALRVLHPVLRQKHLPIARQEFAENQLELGYEERLTMGRSSLFRSSGFREATNAANVEQLLNNTLNVDSQPDLKPVEALVSVATQTAVAACLDGNVEAAIDQLSDNHPELIYARAQLLFEASRFDEAVNAYQTLVTKFPKSRLSIAGRNALRTF